MGQDEAPSQRRPASLTKRWQPKDWRPEYQAMVAMSCVGKGNAEICRILKAKYDVEYTPQHVSNVLNCDKGEEVRKQFMEKMTKAMEDEATMLGRITNKALKRIEQTLDNDDIAQNSPFAILDRALKVVTELNPAQSNKKNDMNGNTNIQNNFFGNLSPEQAAALTGGLNKADEVKRIHAKNE